MKKIALVLAGLLVGGAVYAATVTNKLGQVITVDSNGVVTSITDPNAAAASTNNQTGLIGIQIVTKALSPANSAGALSDATPRALGDILLYVNAASNRVWFANQTTNWLDLD